MSFLRFPEGFEWGAATAAAQIEGAAFEDGKGESVWDRFSRVPGAVIDGDTPDSACDHYHRFEEDIEIMKRIGLKHYRLSLSWPRIIPDGRGKVNPAGIAFYRKLLGGLNAAGIKPAVTLYHWDLPQKLQDEGGWETRETACAFAAYARVCFDSFGDLVTRWFTHNEPQVVTDLGYGQGIHAPGLKHPGKTAQVAHHLLLSHGLAVGEFRASGAKGEIGIVLNMIQAVPENPADTADVAAAEFEFQKANRWFSDPIFLGRYPEAVLAHLKAKGHAPEIRAGDFETISRPIDLLGINYYMTFGVTAAPTAENAHNVEMSFGEQPRTCMDWGINPEGLRALLGRVASAYPGVPLWIAENGAAFDDEVVGGRVSDPDRLEYLSGHFSAAYGAIADGVPLKGYYVWSLLDNFEWGWGYGKRFGIVHVDFATQKRIIKESGLWYGRVMADNGFESR